MARQRTTEPVGTRVLGDEPPRSGGTPTRGVWRGSLIAAVGFAVLLVIAVIVANSGGHGTSAPAPAPSAIGGPQTQNPVGGNDQTSNRRTVDGVPVGYPHTKAGAVQAAVNYEIARSSAAYFTDSAARTRILRAMMASNALQQQISDDNDATGRVVKSLGLTPDTAGDLVARAAALGTRVSNYSDQVATVDVWMAGIVGVTSPKAPLPVSASWTTYTLTLSWENSDWKLSALSSADGPTPLQTTDDNPSGVQDFQQANQGFDAPPYAG